MEAHMILDQATMEQLGPYSKVLQNRWLRRTITLDLYSLKQYNLFREEPEGFSKLILALARLNNNNLTQTGNEIRELIGYF